MNKTSYIQMHEPGFTEHLHNLVNDLQYRLLYMKTNQDGGDHIKTDLLVGTLRIDFGIYVFEDEANDHNYGEYTMHERVYKLLAYVDAMTHILVEHGEELDPDDYAFLYECLGIITRDIKDYLYDD